MWRRLASGVLLLIGLLLLILGATWKHFYSPQSYWTAEQAKEYAEAQVALKAVATSGVRRTSELDDPKLAEARARFEKSAAELERAVAARQWSGLVIGGVGIVAVAAGIFLYLTRPAGSPELSSPQ
jgi:hypothetical protein